MFKNKYIKRMAVANCNVKIDNNVKDDLKEEYGKLAGTYPIVNYPKLTFSDFRIIYDAKPIDKLPLIEMNIDDILRSYEVRELINTQRKTWIHGHISRTTPELTDMGLRLHVPLYFIRLEDYIRESKGFLKKVKDFEKTFNQFLKKC